MRRHFDARLFDVDARLALPFMKQVGHPNRIRTRVRDLARTLY